MDQQALTLCVIGEVDIKAEHATDNFLALGSKFISEQATGTQCGSTQHELVYECTAEWIKVCTSTTSSAGGSTTTNSTDFNHFIWEDIFALVWLEFQEAYTIKHAV